MTLGPRIEHPRTTRSILIRLIGLALMAHVALSWPLWWAGAGRTFPLLPVWGEGYAPLFSAWSHLPALVLFAALAFAVVFPAKKHTASALAATLTLLVGLDLNRLQPWTYFYLLALGLIVAAGQAEGRLTNNLRWLMAAVYAWGGLNKITPYFAEDNFPWFCEAFFWTKPLAAFPALGYLVAAAEVLLALGLLRLATRSIFRWIAVGFHLFVTLALSPWGLDWNIVVIPWNLAMAGIAWVVFSDGMDVNAEARRSSVFIKAATTVLLAFAWVFPLLNVWHRWDEPLSWKMYSNTQTEAGFFIKKNSASCPEIQRVWAKHAYESGSKLLFDDWAFSDLHVPAYNSPYAHQRLAQYLCRCATDPGRSGLWRFTVQRWNRSAERWENIPCTALIR
ncbi:MAG: hypothetical protein ABMA02_01895 [Saprospiraceae bacterium]